MRKKESSKKEDFFQDLKKLVGWECKVKLNDGSIIKGIIMERPKIFEDKILVIKLDNGYNIGISVNKIRKIEKVRKYEIKHKIIKKEQETGGKKVSIIGVGGTIASRVDYRTGGVYAGYSVEDLIERFPKLSELAVYKTKQIMNVMSEDIYPKLYIKIAKEVYKEVIDNDNYGIIITHGTDTMHFTSSMLSFLIQNLNKPIVLTGAQRSTDRPSTDAYLNLLTSVYVALYNIAEVGICMHGSSSDLFSYFHRGTRVRKMHTSRRDAFRSINDKPLLKVYPNGKVEEINENIKRRSGSEPILYDKIEERVAMVYSYPGINREIIDFFIDKGYRGIVLVGTGLGHFPVTFKENSVLDALIRAYEEKIVTVMTSQTLYGRVHPYVYTNLRKLSIKAKVVYLEDMLPEVAYTKLMWVLGNFDFEEARKIMLKNIAGEISPKSLYF